MIPELIAPRALTEEASLARAYAPARDHVALELELAQNPIAVRVAANRDDRGLVTRAVYPAPDRRLGVVAERGAAEGAVRVGVDPAEGRRRATQPSPGLLLLCELLLRAARAVASFDIRLIELATGQAQPSVAHVRERD